MHRRVLGKRFRRFLALLIIVSTTVVVIDATAACLYHPVPTFSLMVRDADVCLRKMFAIPTLNVLSSGTCLMMSAVMRWHPLLGAVIVIVRCAHPTDPVLICREHEKHVFVMP